MIFTTRDFVTRENHCRIASRVTKIVIHGNSCIVLYVFNRDPIVRCEISNSVANTIREH